MNLWIVHAWEVFDLWIVHAWEVFESWIVHAWEVFDSWTVPAWSLKNKGLFRIGLVDHLVEPYKQGVVLDWTRGSFMRGRYWTRGSSPG